MNYLDEIEELLIKFYGNTKLGRIANSLEDRLKVQKTVLKIVPLPKSHAVTAKTKAHRECNPDSLPLPSSEWQHPRRGPDMLPSLKERGLYLQHIINRREKQHLFSFRFIRVLAMEPFD